MGTLIEVEQANVIARLQQMWAAYHTVSYAVVNPADRLSYRCSQAGCDVLAAMAQSIKDKLGDVFSDDIE